MTNPIDKTALAAAPTTTSSHVFAGSRTDLDSRLCGQADKAIKIYIVDDNQSVSHSLKFLFNAIYDIDVVIFNNPLLFLDVFSPDCRGCVIIDLFMPLLNGDELLREMNRRGNNLSVMMMSGNVSKDVVAQCIGDGVHAFISKPFDIERLLEQVGLILQQLLMFNRDT